jgi:hypothetical protein
MEPFLSPEFLEAFRKVAEKISEAFANYSFEDNFRNDLKEAFNALPNSYKTLSKFGWYPPSFFSVSQINKFSYLFENERIEEADKDISNIFKEHLKFVESTLLSKYPKRKAILITAFKAHSNKDFLLSIPVFLSQAEGICYDITEIKLFSKKIDKPKLAALLQDTIEGSWLNLILQPFAEVTALNASEKDRINYPGTLNRHEILHGISIDYGTEINSLKSISLLFYLGDLFEMTMSKNKKAN